MHTGYEKQSADGRMRKRLSNISESPRNTDSVLSTHICICTDGAIYVLAERVFLGKDAVGKPSKITRHM